MYKTIFLDWSGTLSPSLFWEQWQSGNKKDREYFSEVRSVFPLLAKGETACWMKGEYTAETYTEYLSALCGVPQKTLLQGLEESCRQMRFVDDRLPFLLAALRKQGVKVVVATDNMDTFTRWTIPALGLGSVFDDMLESYTLKCLKKDRDRYGNSLFFHSYQTKEAIGPGDSLLIDDTMRNQVVVQWGIDFHHLTAKDSLYFVLEEILAGLYAT